MTSASTPPARSSRPAVRRRRCRPGVPRPARCRRPPCSPPWPAPIRPPGPRPQPAGGVSRCSPTTPRAAAGPTAGYPAEAGRAARGPAAGAARPAGRARRAGATRPPPRTSAARAAAGHPARRRSAVRRRATAGTAAAAGRAGCCGRSVALLGLGLLAPVVAFLVGWVVFDVPSANQTAVTQVATFKYADGAALATIRPDNVNRTIVPLDQVPEHVRQAVLSAEDRSFYSNPGFDLTGIGRALWNQATGGVGGGSTITQQYVKVSTGQDSASLLRKYKEIVLAVKISQEQSKDQILENYLNVIYLGRGAYGIQAASQAYFGKDVKDLTVSEGAMLAGTIQSPSRWDPAKNLEKSTERWNFVLDGMVAQGWLPGRRPRPGAVPGVPAGGAAGRRHPRRRRRPRLQAGDGRARGPRDHRAGDQHRGPHDRPDDRLEAPGAGRRRGDEGAQGAAGQPAGRAGVGRPEDRGDPRLLRRLERGRRRLRPGPAAARLVVQAVRALGGAAGQPPGRRAGQHLRRVVAAGLPRACGSATPRGSAATRARCSRR